MGKSVCDKCDGKGCKKCNNTGWQYDCKTCETQETCDPIACGKSDGLQEQSKDQFILVPYYDTRQIAFIRYGLSCFVGQNPNDPNNIEIRKIIASAGELFDKLKNFVSPIK